MKIIFVTNDISYYGASRSLRALLIEIQKNNLFEVKLVIPKRLFGKNNIVEIENWFSIKKSNIYEFSLPFYNRYKGKNKSIFPFVYTLLSRINAKKIRNFFYHEKPDIIHLNSLTIIDIASVEFNFVLHVREILEDHANKRYLQNKLNLFKKVIFIDHATKSAFNLFNINKCMILNNPFNMTHLTNVEYSNAINLLPETYRKHIIISLIGKIHSEKGSDFIIDVFNKLKRSDVLLVIMGSGEENYCKELKKLSLSNIIFLNESPNVDPLYKISDYIIRGESYPCIGRTTFEGLYAGISVILPGPIDFYENNILEYKNYRNNIFIYNPRDESSLLKLLYDLSPIKIEDRVYKSNVNKYLSDFENFIVNE